MFFIAYLKGFDTVLPIESHYLPINLCGDGLQLWVFYIMRYAKNPKEIRTQ